MAEITTKTKVECSDGPGGKSTHLIADPESGKLTHFVVKDKHFPNSPDRLVPIDLVKETAGGVIRLSCTRKELENLDPYTTIHYVQKGTTDYSLGGQRLELANTSPLLDYAWVAEAEDKLLPEGELDVSRDMIVKTGGKKIGKVDGLIVDPDSGGITHLLMREGHLWGAKDVSIPITAVDSVDEDEVHLKIDKEAINELPDIPLQTHSD